MFDLTCFSQILTTEDTNMFQLRILSWQDIRCYDHDKRDPLNRTYRFFENKEGYDHRKGRLWRVRYGGCTGIYFLLSKRHGKSCPCRPKHLIPGQEPYSLSVVYVSQFEVRIPKKNRVDYQGMQQKHDSQLNRRLHKTILLAVPNRYCVKRIKHCSYHTEQYSNPRIVWVTGFHADEISADCSKCRNC